MCGCCSLYCYTLVGAVAGAALGASIGTKLAPEICQGHFNSINPLLPLCVAVAPVGYALVGGILGGITGFALAILNMIDSCLSPKKSA